MTDRQNLHFSGSKERDTTLLTSWHWNQIFSEGFGAVRVVAWKFEWEWGIGQEQTVRFSRLRSQTDFWEAICVFLIDKFQEFSNGGSNEISTCLVPSELKHYLH